GTPRGNIIKAEKKSTEERPGAAFSVNEFKLSKGVLVYHDKKTGEKTEFKDFNLAIKALLIPDTSGDIIKNASFTGSFDCKEVQKGYLKININ
ncbi:hypothetical protein HKBW3S09_01963, partial [Candidatus Hakubella thermalkaliphila]